MNNEPLRHHKAQSRRDGHKDGNDHATVRTGGGDGGPAKTGGRRRWGLRIVVGLLAIAIVAVLTGYAALRFGIEGEQLDKRVRDTLTALAGPDLTADLTGARIVLGDGGRLAVSARAIQLHNTASGTAFARLDTVRIGMSPRALLGGAADIDSLIIEGGELVMPGDRLTADSGGDTGLVDPDAVLDSLFSHLDRLFVALEAPRVGRVELSDVAVVPQALGIETPIRIAEAQLTRRADGVANLTATLDGAAGPVRVNVQGGPAAGAQGDAASLEGTVSGVALDLTRDGWRKGQPIDDIWQIGGVLDARFSARGEPGARTLSADMEIADLTVLLKDRIDTQGRAQFSFELAEGSGKLEMRPSELLLGRSFLRFEGAIGPDPQAGQDGESNEAYRFELVSNDGQLAPVDSPEPAVAFRTKIAGRLVPAERRLSLNEMVLRTGGGEVIGQSSMVFTGRYTPAAFLNLRIPRLTISHAKQIWPPSVAPRTRGFVLEHVFGGTINGGELEMNVQADRIGAFKPLQADELTMSAPIEDSRFDLVGDLPPIRDATGVVKVAGISSTITLETGTAYMQSGRSAEIDAATMVMADPRARPFYGDVTLTARGTADAVGELLSLDPINAFDDLSFGAADLSGDVTGKAEIRFPIVYDGARPPVTYDMDIAFSDLAIAKPIEEQLVTAAAGTLEVDNQSLTIRGEGRLNDIPARLALVHPLNESAVEPSRDVSLRIDDATRDRITPGLNELVKGTISMDLTAQDPARDVITTDLTEAVIDLPFAGWSKSAGIPAKAEFVMNRRDGMIAIRDFALTGESFSIKGDIDLADGVLQAARFSEFRLNPGDRVTADLKRRDGRYHVTVDGERVDGRALVKQATSNLDEIAKQSEGTPVTMTVKLRQVNGFNREVLNNVAIDYAGRGLSVDSLQINAASQAGGGIALTNRRSDGRRTVKLESNDAGAILRFLDIYPRMQGGRISIDLGAADGAALSGLVSARDFVVVDEPRLASLVSQPPAQGGGSLESTLERNIDTSRVAFDEGTFRIEKGKGYLIIAEGILRGPLIGSTFSGTLYDAAGNMNINGTFMPAYGLNRLFGEIPVLGAILGNGTDRGLIGITYKLAGPAKSPNVLVNPVSVIAPGVFRQIFEYR